MDNLWKLGVADLRRAYAEDGFSAIEVVAAVLERIERCNAKLGALTHVSMESSLEQAERLDRIPADERGPLHGVPVAIKELIDVAGAPISFGSDVFRERVALEDAEVVRRLRAAGAIIVGITRAHEFAWGITTRHPRNGGTVNPWDPTRTAGGSSGGSAVAVATGCVPLALGTDTGGSIRIPAAFNGIWGLKPTWGRISKRGVLPLAPSLDVVGLLARSPEDLRLGFDAISGWDVRDPESEPSTTGDGHADAAPEVGRLRLVIAPRLHVRSLSRVYAEAFGRFVAQVEALGARVDETDISANAAATYGVIQLAEALNVHKELLKTYPVRAADYGEDVAARLDMASAVTLDDYLLARRRMREIKAMLLGCLQGRDALLLPVGASGPSLVSDPDVGRIDGREFPLREVVLGYTTPVNLAGLPACALPVGFDDGGVPIGVQIIGPPGHDERILSIAGALAAVAGSVPGFPPLRDSA